MGWRRHKKANAVSRPQPRLPLWLTLTLLALAGGGSAFVSELVHRRARACDREAEPHAGLRGPRDRCDRATPWRTPPAWCSRGTARPTSRFRWSDSVAQIAAFLFPLLVLVSAALSTTLTFSLAPVYIGALALTALALAQVTGDGEAAAFEGWALVALYVVLGAFTLYE